MKHLLRFASRFPTGPALLPDPKTLHVSTLLASLTSHSSLPVHLHSSNPPQLPPYPLSFPKTSLFSPNSPPPLPNTQPEP